MNDYFQQIFIDLEDGVDGFPLSSEELSTHKGIELVLEVCLFDVGVGMDIWIFCGGENEEMVFEGKEQGIYVFGLDDLLDLIGVKCVWVDPDELICVEGIVFHCHIKQEHSKVRQDRTDLIICLQCLPFLFELVDLFVVPTFCDSGLTQIHKLGVGGFSLF